MKIFNFKTWEKGWHDLGAFLTIVLFLLILHWIIPPEMVVFSHSFLGIYTGLFFTWYILSPGYKWGLILLVHFVATWLSTGQSANLFPEFISLSEVLCAIIPAFVFKRLQKKITGILTIRGIVYLVISSLVGASLSGLLIFSVIKLPEDSGFDIQKYIDWILSGIAGTILVAPLWISWRWQTRSELLKILNKSGAELALLISSSIFLFILIFNTSLFNIDLSVSFPYLLLPVIFWAVFRFPVPVVTLVMVLISLLAFSFSTSEVLHLKYLFLIKIKYINSIQLFLMFLNIFSYSIAYIILSRSESEKKALQNEIKYKVLLNSLPHSVFVKNRKSEFITVNQNFAAMVNATPEEMEGKNDYDYFPKEYAEKFIEGDNRVFNEKKIIEFEEKFMSVNGERWIHTTKVPVRDEQGKYSTLIGIFWDTTEQRLMEAEKARVEKKIRQLNEKLEDRVVFRTKELERTLEALRQSEEQFREAFHTAMHGMALISTEGNFIQVNQALADILGYEISQLLQLNLRKISLRTDYVKELNRLKKLYAGSISNYQTEKRLIHKENIEVWVLESYSLIRNSEGKPLHIVSQIIDITERKQAETQLRKYSETLTTLLREVNHRVKNNLSALIAMLHLEEERATSTGNTAFVGTINDLISRIQGLATLHSLLSSQNWQPIDVRILCEQMFIAAVHGLVENHKVKLTVQSPSIKINSNQAHHLTLVLNELATNYYKYGYDKSKTGELQVIISNEAEKLKFLIKDNGPGYPQSMVDGDFKQTGIGFDLIRGIVTRSLEGEIAIRNENGAVTEISFDNEMLMV